MSEGLVEVAADNAWLRSRLYQVFEDLDVKVLSTADHVEFGVDLIKNNFQLL